MKVVYWEEIETKWALSKKKRCTCGSHKYEIVHVYDEALTTSRCVIRCPKCGRETYEWNTEEYAMRDWCEWK
jgi:hypothetical protein